MNYRPYWRTTLSNAIFRIKIIKIKINIFKNPKKRIINTFLMKNQLNKNALKILEQDFNDILRNLAKDHKFNEFKNHYENMLHELKQSHEKEKDLVN